MTTTVIIHNKHRDVTVENQDRAWDDKAGNWSPTSFQFPPNGFYLCVSTVVIGAGELYQGCCTDTRRLIITENEA